MSREVEAAHMGGVPGCFPRHPMAGVADAPGLRVEPIVTCRTCGTDVDKKVFALNCRTCGEILVRESDLTERARPDVLLPFAVDENVARAAFATWVSSRRLAPKSLKAVRHPQSVTGVFLPFWSFGAGTSSTYAGQRGETRHRMIRSGGRWRSQSYTKWYPASGQVSRGFSDLMTPGCSPLASKIPAWPLADCGPYSPEAASGRRVVGYDVEPEAGFEAARRLMAEEIERDVRADIGGDHQRVHQVSTTYFDPCYTLILVPAWLVSYRHEKRTRSALVNGSTAEIAGDRPYSGAKISLLIAVVAVVAVALFLLIRHG